MKQLRFHIIEFLKQRYHWQYHKRYGNIPERIGQNEEPTSTNEEQFRND